MDYKNGKIYKLQINDGNFYIGSTASELRRRLCQHKSLSKKHPETKVYKHIGGNWDNVKIILIETIECKNKDELRKKEDEYIQKELKNELCLNLNRSFVTEEETKERKKEYNKVYDATNKEKIKERKKEYYEVNKEQMKEYREANKEKIKEQKKEYYKQNREKLLKYQKEYDENKMITAST